MSDGRWKTDGCKYNNKCARNSKTAKVNTAVVDDRLLLLNGIALANFRVLPPLSLADCYAVSIDISVDDYAKH